MRKILIRQMSDEDLLKILGLSEDDVILKIIRYEYELPGEPTYRGYRIEYSTKVE